MKINYHLDNFFATIFVLIVVGLMTLLPNILDPFIPIEKIIENMDLGDIYFSRLKKKDNFDTNIVIVNIAKSREDIAQQIEIISYYKPAVIGIDAYFLKRGDVLNDIKLSIALSKYDNYVLASYFYNTKSKLFTLEDPDTLQLSIPEFSQDKSSGFINFEGDGSFHTIRNSVPKYSYRDSIYYSFDVEIVKKFSEKKANKYIERKNRSEIINYIGNIESFIFVDIEQILDTSFDENLFRKKIVLLGYHGRSFSDSLSMVDKYFTPLNSHYVSRGLPDMYGVVIHANIISMILNENYISSLSKSGIILVSFILCFLNITIFEYIRKRFPQLYGGELKIFIILEFVVFLFLVFLIFDIFNFKINVLFVFFVILLSQDISEIYFSSFKNMLNNIFGKLKK
jgi:CHASE2 domain-containing sensor protein